MNVLDVVIIIGFYQTFIFAGLLLAKKNRTTSDRNLAILFLIHGITLLLGYMEIYNRNHDYPFPFFINSSTPVIMLHGPVLWFYIKSLTAQHFRFRPVYLLHFLPFVLVLFMMTMGIYSLPAQERIILEKTEAFREDYIFPVIVGMIAVITQGYFIWGLLLLKKFKSRIKNYFSEIGKIDLTWLKTLLVASVIFYAGISLLYIADYLFEFFSYHLLQRIGFAYAALFLLVLGLRGYRQGNIFSSRQVKFDLEKISSDENMVANEKLNDQERIFIKELLRFMDQEKPFLNAELNLASLADQLRVTPDYLSGILNGKLNKNFFDFINQYRIEEFKRLCREEKNSNITIMGLAWDAGFNSKATFNRVFKKNTGITPGEFVQKAAK